MSICLQMSLGMSSVESRSDPILTILAGTRHDITQIKFHSELSGRQLNETGGTRTGWTKVILGIILLFQFK